MAKTFSEAEWRQIYAYTEKYGHKHGLPKRRTKSVVLGSFNIRKLGAVKKRSKTVWDLLALICRRYDLLAIQEVMDDLDGIKHLRDLVNAPKLESPEYGLVVSDTTGFYPSEGTAAERLAFLFRRRRVSRTEVASDITYDRTKVSNTLFEHRDEFWEAFEDYEKKLKKKKGDTPVIPNPQFLTFIRQPLCVSFRIGGVEAEKPYSFLAVTCHLLYGRDPSERRREFYALLSWLIDRAKHPEYMYYPNILLMGDCNLDFHNPKIERPKIDAFLKSLNKKVLDKEGEAEINFPFLDAHPGNEKVFATNACQGQTYDQVAILFHDPWLPDYKQNQTAGTVPDGYDYGVFNFMDAIAHSLCGTSFKELGIEKQTELISKTQHTLTDHLPIWIRLPLLG
jgi:hypothetical protein